MKAENVCQRSDPACREYRGEAGSEFVLEASSWPPPLREARAPASGARPGIVMESLSSQFMISGFYQDIFAAFSVLEHEAAGNRFGPVLKTGRTEELLIFTSLPSVCSVFRFKVLICVLSDIKLWDNQR